MPSLVDGLKDRTIAMNSTRSKHPSPAQMTLDVTSRFGARLRELRKAKRLTQHRMSVEFGIDRSFISEVENGHKSISLPMLEVIAIGLDLTLSDLFQDI
jgi:DNA-binding XRE family transcriptional regulator